MSKLREKLTKGTVTRCNLGLAMQFGLKLMLFEMQVQKIARLVHILIYSCQPYKHSSSRAELQQKRCENF